MDTSLHRTRSAQRLQPHVLWNILRFGFQLRRQTLDQDLVLDGS